RADLARRAPNVLSSRASAPAAAPILRSCGARSNGPQQLLCAVARNRARGMSSNNSVTWHRGTLLTLAITLVPCLAAYMAGRREAGAAPARPAKASFQRDVAPVVAKYCAACHGPTKPQAGIVLTRFKTEAAAAQSPEVWEKVGAMLSAHQMPPKGLP